MGSSIPSEMKDKPKDSRATELGEPSEFQRLHVYAVAESALKRIDIIRSGHISSIPLQGELEWTEVRTISRLQRGEYCYVRVVQQDGGVAWSSPIFGEGRIYADSE